MSAEKAGVSQPMSAEKAGPRLGPVEPREASKTLTCPRDRAGEGKWSPDPAFPPTGLQEVARRFRCRGCYSTVCDLPLDCPVQDVVVKRGDQAMFSCTVNFQLPKEEITYSWKFAGGGPERPAGADSGPILLPRHAAGPGEPGADPARAAHAPWDLRLRDHARPAPPGATLLLSERDGSYPARGDGAPAGVSGGTTLGSAGGGDDRTLEAEPGRAAGQPRGSDAQQPGPARNRRSLSFSRCDPAGVNCLLISPGCSFDGTSVATNNGIFPLLILFHT
ncbi:sperm acrosome membrane-associated protein 6 isoform 1-T1 [Molossus nigricans]